jgi:DNA-binding NarL/FixJ family response regulator
MRLSPSKDGRTPLSRSGAFSKYLHNGHRFDLNGIEATRQTAKSAPVNALSTFKQKLHNRNVQGGLPGYLLKDCEFDELVNAIRWCLKQKYISPAISDVVVDNYTQPANAKDSAFSILSQREREVLQLLTEGKGTKQIGKRLHISAKTVEVHRLNLMNKLKIDSIAQLTKYAIQEGLTQPEP